MKKTALLTLFYFLQTILIIGCESKPTDSDVTRSINPLDHMATIAALIAKASPLPEEHRKLYYKSIVFFASKLSSTNGHYCSITTPNTPFSSYVLPDEPDEDTFCMFISGSTSRDYMQTKRDTALSKIPSIPPIATFTTQNKHQYDYDTITTTLTEPSSKCSIIINHLDDTSQTKSMHINPRARASFVYNIGNMPTISPSGSTITPIDILYPDHDILLKAWKPAESDGTEQTVSIWALAQAIKD